VTRQGQEATSGHPAPSTVPALQDWLEVRGPEPGSLFCAVLKSGRLVRAGSGPARLSPGAAWRICRERGLKGQIQAPAPHDLRRTWIGDLLDLGVDPAPVRKMAGHASRPLPPATTVGIEACSAGPPSCSMCPTRSLRTEPLRQRGSGQRAATPAELSAGERRARLAGECKTN
jgi:hypothetical protein